MTIRRDLNREYPFPRVSGFKRSEIKEVDIMECRVYSISRN